MREEFDLTMSDDELEAQGRTFCTQNLRERMTFEQFIIARISSARRVASSPRRVRLDRADLEINPHRDDAKPSWLRYFNARWRDGIHELARAGGEDGTK